LPELKHKKGIASYQLRALQAIEKCRTPGLGGSLLACSECGTVHYITHSCRNRHCPQCQGIDKEIWVEGRKRELLPVKYFHAVFTVPGHLHELFRFNKTAMYNLLFEKVWETLSAFAEDKKLLGAELGIIAIMHTWTQQMKFHPHMHCIIPAGGINQNGQWVHCRHKGDFLFDVKQLSAKFSAIFAEKLRKLKQQGKITKRVPKDLIPKPWVVYAKQAFGNPENTLEYLGRYTHRAAISNARIIKATDTHVTFSWLDREDKHTKKYETLEGVKFLERFIQHIVPPYFRKIRYYGFLSHRKKKRRFRLQGKLLALKPGWIIKFQGLRYLKTNLGSRLSWSVKNVLGI